MRQRALPLFPARGKPRAYVEPKGTPPKELSLHIGIADYLRAYADPSWRWAHYPAGEERDKRQAAKLKAMGLQRGWPDFLLVAPGGRLHALEAKRRGEDMTDEQEAFAAWCAEQSIPFACTDDLRDAVAVLTQWGAIRTSVRLSRSEP
jgi:hypothetical protein